VLPVREMTMHYFLGSGGTGMDSTKNAPGHVVPNLCFLHQVGSVGHVVHSGASEERNRDALFFMLGWDQYGYDKKALRHVMSNLCSCIRWVQRVT
jgi:hypothetical protein